MLAHVLLLLALPPTSLLPEPAAADTTGPFRVPAPIQSASPLSDLAVRFGARGEFGGDWTLFRPCDASFQLACRPGLIPQLDPDIQFGLEAQGSVADRIFVNVDYDQTREFAGANRFQVHYQGQTGELLQRVEVGDVTFALPETRFLARGIPVGNFGVLARGDLGGGLEVQTVFAQQQGARRSREFRLGGSGLDAGVIHRDTLVLDDADYVRGQFFFLVDPSRIARSPHMDVLSLRPADAPPGLAPGAPPIQLYRMERDPLLRQQVEGYIQADAIAEGPEGLVRESGWFRYLRPGEDYYLHPSGLWIALRTPLRPGDALAVTYIAQNGDEIGDYNPEGRLSLGEVPTLRLLRATSPQHQPGRATWDFEMKNVYRVSGSDAVDPGSLDVSISLGEESAGQTFRFTPDGRAIPYLRLFGLDEHSAAERVDRASIFHPASEGVEPVGLQGAFLVFPTLRPFLEPPPVPSEGLTAEAAAALLGGDLNRRIYEASDPFERDAGGLYRVNLSAEIRSSGVASVFPLGAFGLRPGSERIYLGNQLLRPLVDYIIDYQTGVVTLLQPEVLRDRSASDLLSVSWEEAAVFQVAPTSVVGASAHLPLAERGGLDFIGLYQIQSEIVNRPRFGSEPAATGLLGVRSHLGWALPSLDRALEQAFGDRGFQGAELRMEGELALSLPDPNRSGDAFLDDFDAGDERAVSLLSQGWHLGSAPRERTGAESVLPPIIDELSAAGLVWQHTWVERDALGDSLGTFEGFFPADIDRQINVAGTQTREAGLRLSFGMRDGGFQDPRWRSLTTLLSPSGLDFTYTEYLDFYVAEGDSLSLVVDLGLVSEDAFFIDDAGRTSGIHPLTGEPWGLGVLDQEGNPLRGEIWNPQVDERGVWVESCVSEPGRVYPPGDPRANCTRGNARRDTEDLNGNGVLDTTERYVRYVVRLDGSSPYLVRDRPATGTGFRLYRIPLRGPDAIQPAGGFTEADWRTVQFMRVTATGSRPGTLTLARMRLVGSRWVKRGVEGVLSGIAGDTLALGGRLEVSPVSVLSEGEAYQAPPGVLEQLDDPTSAVSGRGVEFNERALGLRYQELGAGDRAEVYFRFLQRPRNFLSYDELRLWVVARRGEWGADLETDFFLKVGSDPENFYLYRTPLTPAPNPDGVRPEDWLPERVVRFEEWALLRRRAEQRLLEEPRGPGDPPLVEWSADSTHAVVLKDRARAPNLAAVREISLGVWNRGGGPVEGEVWVNELRLGSGVRTPGTARFFNVELDGGSAFQARLEYSGQGPHFRQLTELPSHQADDAVSLSGTLQLGTALPEGWGWDLPLSVSYRRTDQDPFYLEGTDLRASELPGLRTAGSSETRVSLAFRTAGDTGHRVADRILSGLDLRLGYASGNATTLTTQSRATDLSGSVGYAWRPAAQTVPLVPDLLDPLARILIPGRILQRLRETELRWTPEEVVLRGGVRQRSYFVDRFDGILATPEGLRAPTASVPEHRLDQDARLAFRPFDGMAFSLDFLTVRDLLDPEEGVRDSRVRPVVEEERRRLLGREVGWETRRELVGRMAFQPRLPDWIRADLGVQTRYLGERDPGLVRFETVPDSIPRLLRNAGSSRDLRASATLDFDAFLEAFVGAPPDGADASAESRGVRWLGRTLAPLNVSVQDGVTSRFHREEVAPGALYQLGWGGTSGFEAVGDVSATSLVDRQSVSWGTGLRLPGTFFLNANRQSIRTETLDRRSDRESRMRIWPDVRLGVGDLPLPGGWDVLLQRASMNLGVQRTRQDVSFGGDLLLQRRLQTDYRMPVEVSFEWVGGIVTRYRGQVGRGEGVDPTGVTERDLLEHGFVVETRLAPATGLTQRAVEPVRLSLVLQYSSVAECRIVTGTERCVDFIDQVARAVGLTVDTWITGVEVGGQMSLVDRRSFTGLQAGFTQFQLGIWGRMLFEAGPVGRLGGGPDPF